MLLWLFFYNPHVFLLCAAACLVFVFAGLPLLLRPREEAGAVPAEGEVLDFEELVVNRGGEAAVVTRLLVRFRTASGHTVVGPAVRGSSLGRLHFRRGQRVPVRYNPANTGQFAVPSIDAARRTYAVVVFCLLGAGLLGLSVLLFILSAILPTA
ncbi:DUF3592 domain-containing protein [Hymenobacter sp. 15J16-1T3B]|uniref:DUF3592 domain-containing protein n=1 Tax=Hymenobacter sp. 15J16-1T3B TaxID=2886941 RepID=UPI001D1208A5|nr:DUF3592 domain-containing protein [Hymenobacter sp. 15J16-1T3B]MCC3160129.1 DUF3592 domain-containing protein [Hymenobacter sp. 15J16-1T3B]